MTARLLDITNKRDLKLIFLGVEIVLFIIGFSGLFMELKIGFEFKPEYIDMNSDFPLGQYTIHIKDISNNCLEKISVDSSYPSDGYMEDITLCHNQKITLQTWIITLKETYKDKKQAVITKTRVYTLQKKQIIVSLVVLLLLIIKSLFIKKTKEKTENKVQKKEHKEKVQKKTIDEENIENKRNHFNNLKKNVFEPWRKHLFDKPISREEYVLCEVDISKSSEIDKTLFKDIRNHFSAVIKEWNNLNLKYEKYKDNCKNFVREVLEIIKEDTSIGKIYGWSVKFIYEKILGGDTKWLEPQIESDGKSIRNKSKSYIYAEDDRKEILEKCLLSFNKIIKLPQFHLKAKKLETEGKKIKKMAEEFNEKLSEIIHSEKLLTGDCRYI